MFPKRQRVEFPGGQGQPISGRLDVPADAPVACAVLAHCFTCTKDLKAATWISRELVARRIAVLRFDFTGLGESAGDFADTNFTSNLADLVAAADFLRSSQLPPRILIGHSLGGTAVLAAASQIPEAGAVVVIAAPSQTAHLHEFLTKQAGPLDADATAEIDVMGRPIQIKGQLLDDLRRHDIEHHIATLGRPLLVFHSPDDDVVNIAHGERIFQVAKHPKTFIALEGADHLLIAREADARFVAEVIASWAARYLAQSRA